MYATVPITIMTPTTVSVILNPALNITPTAAAAKTRSGFAVRAHRAELPVLVMRLHERGL